MTTDETCSTGAQVCIDPTCPCNRPDPSTTGTVLGEREFNALELETMWRTVPADAKPGDDALIHELSVPQRLALPAAFHRPIWDDLGRPSLWHCAVCWGDGWSTGWPCEAAARDGRSVVLDPEGLSAAREEGRQEVIAKLRDWGDNDVALSETAAATMRLAASRLDRGTS